ncbi:IS1182 family transposase [Streptomyces sp. NPDC051561]|uniref:IS1182 family transposase n=1 Tax=Streptomyces sp. NPDC051561 TaxID=3365658 RepID=UPI0037985980
MSMRPGCAGDVPLETARVAGAAFPRGSLAIRIRDRLGVVFTDEEFAGLFPAYGQPAWSPGRLALVLVLQFAEGLPDRQAAEAVRGRIDWKYALNLELTDPGFDFSVLSEFRSRLVTGMGEERLLQAVLDAAAASGLVQRGGEARTDSTHVLASIRLLNRLELAGETVRAALNALAAAAPNWLVHLVEADWFDRYSHRVEEYHLPRAGTERTELAETIGRDGSRLLHAVFAPGSPGWLRQVPAVDILRRVWVQQYRTDGGGRLRWRDPTELPPATVRIESPYEAQAKRSMKRAVAWTGYKVHLTETCARPSAHPHLITHVATTSATVQDVELTAAIHADLADRGLLPQVHLADTAYIDAHLLVTAARDYGVELLGPVRADTSWQASTGGFSMDDFTIDWEKRRAICPNGKVSQPWLDTTRADAPAIRVQFSTLDCAPCPLRTRCTRRPRGRQLTLRAKAEHEALRRRRDEQETARWQRRYALRQGVEGTIAQAVNGLDLRRCRYRGLAKTHLQHLLTASAINLRRISAWLAEAPFETTRTSSFASLLFSG